MIIARLYWDNEHPSPWVSLRNKTEYNAWARDVRLRRPGTKTEYALCDEGWSAEHLLSRVEGEPSPPEYVKRMAQQKEKGMNRLDRIEAQIEALTAEKLRIALLPQEPTAEPDTGVVLWFEKVFRDGQEYTYAVVKAGDGLWYTTGPRSPKGYTWDELIEWIGEDVDIWVATEWSPL